MVLEILAKLPEITRIGLQARLPEYPAVSCSSLNFLKASTKQIKNGPK